MRDRDGCRTQLPGVPGDVEYARIGDDLPRLMAYAPREHGVRSVLCEGGPTLNSFLFAAGLVDELFLTMNPKVVGGASALTIVAGRELVEPARARSGVGRGGRGRALHRAGGCFPLKCRNPCTCRVIRGPVR